MYNLYPGKVCILFLLPVSDHHIRISVRNNNINDWVNLPTALKSHESSSGHTKFFEAEGKLNQDGRAETQPTSQQTCLFRKYQSARKVFWNKHCYESYTKQYILSKSSNLNKRNTAEYSGFICVAGKT